MIRVITASTANGDREEVYFTEDLKTPAAEFFFMEDMTIVIDELIESLPNRFPLDYVLVR